jgi:hypothetical protein
MVLVAVVSRQPCQSLPLPSAATFSFSRASLDQSRYGIECKGLAQSVSFWVPEFPGQFAAAVRKLHPGINGKDGPGTFATR